MHKMGLSNLSQYKCLLLCLRKHVKYVFKEWRNFEVNFRKLKAKLTLTVFKCSYNENIVIYFY